ncbi:MAG: aspartyl-trna synthetase [Beijerinckiaceae bacterium]|nr:aspartyl-trna synthetase [Beijerinckiaceae bacterium]
MRIGGMGWIGVAVLAALMTGAAAAPMAKAGGPETTGSIASPNLGPVTKLPVPRFVSLKPSDTPLREGPGKSHAITWIFKKEGLPVEITAEFENWRRVRDYEGAEGWVYHSRLSGRRTVMVRAKDKSAAVPIFKTAEDEGVMTAKLELGVVSLLDNCSGRWCKIHGEGYEGYIRQDKLWGVYPAEIVK